METEEEAQEALDTFGLGIETSEKYLKEAEDYATESRSKVDLVKTHLIEKRDKAKDNVDAKGEEYTSYAKEQRAIAYGTCAGVCVAAGTWTMGAACVACYATAATTVELVLEHFRDKNEELRKKYEDMAGDVDVVLDKVADIIKGLGELDYDIEKVAQLIENARLEYEDITLFGEGKISFLTEDAAEQNGRFADFLEMLENTVKYERHLQTCGKPDCEATCMQEPILNEGNDYKGCWNQTYRGDKCKNWLEADGSLTDSSLDHNYCRDPYNKGQAWCYLEFPENSIDSQNWAYCVDPLV